MEILDFTVEETNLIAMYKLDTKAKTILSLHDDYPYFEEDMQEIATSAARKLNLMTDEEFESIVFVPVFETEDS